MGDFRQAIIDKAQQLGFDRVAIAQADEPLALDHERYEAFLAQGMHAGMDYLDRNREVRRSVAHPGILQGARSVICLAQRCAVAPDPAQDRQGLVPHIARYARGRDYHGHVRKRLEALAAFVRAETGAAARALIDTAPVLERAWAARAGLGFIGKNGMLIVPGLGSQLILGEVVTTLSLDAGTPLPGRCGQCTLCLQACPTQAFAQPYVLDARRCISYRTIEHRGSVETLEPTGDWIFGCDTCQDVCPYNRSPRGWLAPGTPFDALERWRHVGPADFLKMDETALRALTQGSPLRRVHADDWKRNALMLLASTGDEQACAQMRSFAQDEGQPEWLRRAAQQAVQRAEARLKAEGQQPHDGQSG